MTNGIKTYCKSGSSHWLPRYQGERRSSSGEMFLVYVCYIGRAVILRMVSAWMEFHIEKALLFQGVVACWKSSPAVQRFCCFEVKQLISFIVPCFMIVMLQLLAWRVTWFAGVRSEKYTWAVSSIFMNSDCAATIGERFHGIFLLGGRWVFQRTGRIGFCVAVEHHTRHALPFIASYFSFF